MNVEEAAKFLGLSRHSVYELCRLGHIEHARIGPSGGKIRITEAACRRYLAEGSPSRQNSRSASRAASSAGVAQTLGRFRRGAG